MSKRKEKLTLGRHKEIGAKLGVMHEDLIHLLVELNRAYWTSGKEMKYIQLTLRNLDELRCKLDSSVFQYYPEEASFDIYYGGDVKDEEGGKEKGGVT